MTSPTHILMVAAENDSLKGGKVGGVADVVRDIPDALVSIPEFSGTVSVVCPSYGFLNEDVIAKAGTIDFPFGGELLTADLYEVAGKRPCPRVRQLVIHHPEFQTIDPASGRKLIYVDDGSKRPFASDATKFAMFCSAVAEGLLAGSFGEIDRLHLHDWHSAFYLILRQFDARLESLKSLRTVYTIHNLALQGIRPFEEDDPAETSTFARWYPHLEFDPLTIADPEYTDCVNPMAVGIRLSDAVHVVSPAYADEVCRPSLPRRNDPDCVFFGGEGLDGDLRQARDEGRLLGILNGSEYAEGRELPVCDQQSWLALLDTLIEEVARWYARSGSARHWLALQRLTEWRSAERARPSVVMTSVTRVVDQKVRLMRVPDAPSPLDRILQQAGDDVVYLLAGSGDRGYETFLDEAARRNSNLIFLNGYSQSGADALYRAGDLFLMPSAFEPCGISQMLAMRDGQPCVVHAIGGLKDTVHDGVTGFTFEGSTPDALGNGFVNCTMQAIRCCTTERSQFQEIRQRAFQTRFLWQDSVREYLNRLY
jgi:starch synthase